MHVKHIIASGLTVKLIPYENQLRYKILIPAKWLFQFYQNQKKKLKTSRLISNVCDVNYKIPKFDEDFVVSLYKQAINEHFQTESRAEDSHSVASGHHPVSSRSDPGRHPVQPC